MQWYGLFCILIGLCSIMMHYDLKIQECLKGNKDYIYSITKLNGFYDVKWVPAEVIQATKIEGAK